MRRLAALYALADNRLNVRLADLEAAMALWDYSCRSVARVFGNSTGCADADRILQALAAEPKGLTRTDIMVSVFKRNLTKERIVAALTLLRDNGWAHMTKTPTARRVGRTLVRRPGPHELNEKDEFVKFVPFVPAPTPPITPWKC